MENGKRQGAMRERGVVVTLVSANSGKCVCVNRVTDRHANTHVCVCRTQNRLLVGRGKCGGTNGFRSRV